MTEMDELEPCPLCDARLIKASDPRMAGMVMHPAGLPLCPIGALHVPSDARACRRMEPPLPLSGIGGGEGAGVEANLAGAARNG